MDIGESIRKLIMAGIGATCFTAEKSKEVLEELSKRGEEALKQGKVVNEELRHTIDDALTSKPVDDLAAQIRSLTEEQREVLQKTIEELRKSGTGDEQ